LQKLLIEHLKLIDDLYRDAEIDKKIPSRSSDVFCTHRCKFIHKQAKIEIQIGCSPYDGLHYN
jgi:hypothetical protein